MDVNKLKSDHQAILDALPPEVRQALDRQVKIETMAVRMNVEIGSIPDFKVAREKAEDFVFASIVEVAAFNALPEPNKVPA